MNNETCCILRVYSLLAIDSLVIVISAFLLTGGKCNHGNIPQAKLLLKCHLLITDPATTVVKYNQKIRKYNKEVPQKYPTIS